MGFMSTVAKALQLLDLFSRSRPQIGLSDLARLNKTTCFRLVSDLCAMGLVKHTGPGRAYRLGPALLRLAALREAALPVLQALVIRCALVGAARGDHAVGRQLACAP